MRGADELIARAIVLCLLLVFPASAKEKAPSIAEVNEAKIRGEVARVEAKAANQRFISDFRQAQIERIRQEDQHFLFVLWTQAIFSIVLTIFVLLVVCSGIYLSFLQFKATAPAIAKGETQADTKLVLSQASFELSSSVIGLFVLLASMFFFYVYIKEVYPIRRLPSSTGFAVAGSKPQTFAIGAESATVAPSYGNAQSPSD